MIDISLIITAHRKNYLVESLLSVVAQRDKDFELVVCLDINIDSSLEEYCKPYIDMIQCLHKRVITIKGNGTAGYARNVAFSQAHGSWICYLDGDDMLSPDAIEVMRTEIKTYRDYDIFSSGMVRITNDGEAVKLEESLYYYPPLDIYDVDPEVIGKPTFFNQFQIMRRTVWEEYKYDTSSNGEDIDFMLIQLLKWRFRKVSKYLYFYRDVSNSFSKELYEKGDFTTQRYLSGFYHEYFKTHFKDKFVGNFKRE